MNNSDQTNSNVKITSFGGYHHNDHWAAMFGFEYFYEGGGNERYQEQVGNMVDRARLIDLPDGRSIIFGSYGPLFMRAVVQNQDFAVYHPGLETDFRLPVQVEEVAEWANTANNEAHIVATGHGILPLHFYATDYAEHAHLYKSGNPLDVHLSGFAYYMQLQSSPRGDANGISEAPPSENIGYAPDQQLGIVSCIKYIGRVLESREITDLGFSHMDGYLVKVKLVQHPLEEEFFAIDMFVNRDQLQMLPPRPGDRVSGLCWLHGRIASAMDIV